MFTDDKAIVSNTEEGLNRMINELNEKAIEVGMKINVQ